MTEVTASAAVSLDAFAAKVGCHFTTASRLRSGDRLPSPQLLRRIVKAYGLDLEEAWDIYTSDDNPRSAFGQYLRDNVFNPVVKSDDATEAA